MSFHGPHPFSTRFFAASPAGPQPQTKLRAAGAQLTWQLQEHGTKEPEIQGVAAVEASAGRQPFQELLVDMVG